MAKTLQADRKWSANRALAGWDASGQARWLRLARGAECDMRCPELPGQSAPLEWTLRKEEILSRAKKSFSPEYKDEAVKMVIETSR
ncbi:MAG TPA: hypothetical protein VGM12_16725, partial [Trebonia sp.]